LQTNQRLEGKTEQTTAVLTTLPGASGACYSPLYLSLSYCKLSTVSRAIIENHEEEQVKILEQKIQHLLEKEVW